MLAFTSIAAKHSHTETQLKCVQSWQEVGYEVISLNSYNEVREIDRKLYKDVRFVATHRHHQHRHGKPLVLINAMLEYALNFGDEHNLFINSDNEIIDTNNFTNKSKELSESGVVIFQRMDYDIKQGKRGGVPEKLFSSGYDGFLINKKWLPCYPQSMMCIGQILWDYWIPTIAIESNIPVYKVTQSYLRHKYHDIQWNMEDANDMFALLRAEMKVKNKPDNSGFARYLFDNINRNSILIT